MIVLKIIAIIFFYVSHCNLFSQDMIFESFNDKEYRGWEFITDQVMGGVSSGNYKVLIEDNVSFIRMTGNVSLKNNGGFIQVRKIMDETKNINFKEIILNARGNNSEYYLHIRTKFTLLPWQYYQAKFSVTSMWENYHLNLKDFKRSGVLLPKKINSRNIKSIALVAFGREHNVQLDVSNIILKN
ncbi:MAG: hypothetical protein CFH34_01556 [Alphaproteobacteria bacterium MarineAlpha9_Bin4]|nr:hypothetical protein [Pelagibacterales bacterium]PPR25168.1 MAG: hypothetical protein CFH34_01556 [Alphaproteobacteria bacterium MarineAlpha9_Bin4]|tara:strand:- start:857 stop:1411 length:555 start_codon:yes stop_codon:yes gene_type:complete